MAKRLKSGAEGDFKTLGGLREFGRRARGPGTQGECRAGFQVFKQPRLIKSATAAHELKARPVRAHGRISVEPILQLAVQFGYPAVHRSYKWSIGFRAA